MSVPKQRGPISEGQSRVRLADGQSTIVDEPSPARSKYNEAATRLSRVIERIDRSMRSWPCPAEWATEFHIDARTHKLRYEKVDGVWKLTVEEEGGPRRALVDCRAVVKEAAASLFPELQRYLGERLEQQTVKCEHAAEFAEELAKFLDGGAE